MESSTRYQLSASLNEVYIPGTSSLPGLALLVSFHGQALRLSYPAEGLVNMKTKGIKADDPIRFELIADGITIGGVSSTVKDVMGESIIGEVQHWLKFTPTFESEQWSAEGEDTTAAEIAPTLQSLYESQTADVSPTKRVARLLVFVTIQQIAKRSKSPSKKNTFKPQTIPIMQGSCPYLERLAMGEQSAMVVLEAVKQARIDMASRLIDTEPDPLPGTKLYVPIEAASGVQLDVEIPNIQAMKFDQLSAKEFERVKLVLSSLAGKAKVLNVLKREIDILRSETALNLQARTDLQETLKETTDQLQAEAAVLNESMKTIKGERAQAVDALQKEVKRSKDLEEENEGLKAKIRKMEHEATQAQAQATRISDLSAMVDSLKRTLSESEKRRQDLTDELDRLQKLAFQHSEDSKTALMDAAKYRESLKLQIKELETVVNADQQDLSKAKSDITALNSQLSIVTDLKSQISTLETENKTLLDRNRALQVAVQSAESDSKAFSSEFSASETKLISDKKRLNEALTQVEGELERKEALIEELNRQHLEAKRNISTLEQLCCIKEDLHQLYEDVSLHNEQSQKAKDVLLHELNYLAERTLMQTHAVMEESRLIERYADFCDEKEKESEELKASVIHFKNRNPVYTPVKEDAIDQALAEFLNGREQMLLVNFQREDSTVYLFGTKRIFMKLENGKIAIRVGGGFMQIEDFLEIYTPLELEKMQNTRTAGSLTKKVLGKWASAVVGKDPISPQKAAKIIHSVVEKASPKFETMFGVRKPSPQKSSPRKERRSLQGEESDK